MRFHKILSLAVLLSLMISNSAFAGITGKIAGRVTDKKTKEALPGVSVMIVGTTRGAATNADGKFVIVNVDPGNYTIRATSVGYQPVEYQGVRVTVDLTTELDFKLEDTATEVQAVVIKSDRPLMNREQTATVKVTSSEEIKNMPVRSYQDVVGASAGVVQFQSNASVNAGRGGQGSTASNLPQLNVRGGRANQVGYIVDGFSVQDPITGLTTANIAPDAIDEITVMTGGFNAEYGRIMSGAVNVTTKRGAKKYSGKISAVTDNAGIGADPQDYNIYDLSLGGPLIPGNDRVGFFFSGSRTWQRNRTARAGIPTDYYDQIASMDSVTLASGSRIPSYKMLNSQASTALNQFRDNQFPQNFQSGWSWNAKLTFDLASNLKMDVGILGSRDDWKEYSTEYMFNAVHAPYYEDRNAAYNAKLTYQLNKKTFVTVGGNYFATERFRGDGVHKKDMMAYGRPSGSSTFDATTLFHSWDDINGVTPTTYTNLGWNPTIYSGMEGDSVAFISGGDEGRIFRDYMQRKSSYVGFDVDVTSQIDTKNEIKLGFDVQKHNLRYYRHLFPNLSYQYLSSPSSAGQDVDQYGYTYNPVTNELEESDDPTGNGLDGAKKPTIFAFYLQDKFEHEGIVINFGLRYDYLDVNTQELIDTNEPLQSDPNGNDSELDATEVKDAKAQTAFSPRLGIGFPITDRTVLHASYGTFYQQPNLFDLYVSYAYLETKILNGGYFYPFGNPNLDWEKTTAYEVGFRHQLNDNSVFEATTYYKSIEDLVQVRNINSRPNSFSSYRNSDYGTVKGFDFSYQSRRVNNIAINLNYSLSWATGTGSTSNTTRNIAWTGEEPPKMTSALDYDQRHKFSFNADYRYGKNAPFSFLNDFGVNLLGSFASGTPYTPMEVYNEVTLGSVSATPAGPINSRYGPWVFRMDLKANKSLKFGRMNLNVYVWVQNLLDRKNAIDTYESSGDPQSTTFLNTSTGQAIVNDPAVVGPHDTTGLTGAEKYRLREQDPRNYDLPRTVRLGVDIGF